MVHTSGRGFQVRMPRWLWRIQHNPRAMSRLPKAGRENAGISQDPLAYSNYASRIEPPGQRHERHALLSVILSRGRNRLELRQIVGYLEPRRFARNEYVSERSHARIVVKRRQRNAIFCNRRWPIRR